jgi:hypothetical protein
MLSSIGLDRQAMFDTGKIENKWAQRMLSTEFVSTQPTAAQCSPEPPLRIGHDDTQFTRVSRGHGEENLTQDAFYPHPPAALRRVPPSPASRARGFRPPSLPAKVAQSNQPSLSDMANKRLALVFFGLFLADMITLVSTGWNSGRHLTPADPLNTTPLVVLLIVAGVLAILFQPDKKIGPSAKGISIGRVPLDSPRDWMLLVLSTAVSLFGIRVTSGLM